MSTPTTSNRNVCSPLPNRAIHTAADRDKLPLLSPVHGLHRMPEVLTATRLDLYERHQPLPLRYQIDIPMAVPEPPIQDPPAPLSQPQRGNPLPFLAQCLRRRRHGRKDADARSDARIEGTHPQAGVAPPRELQLRARKRQKGPESNHARGDCRRAQKQMSLHLPSAHRPGSIRARFDCGLFCCYSCSQ